MECYVSYCVKGFYAFNENKELIAERLFEEDEILQKLIEIDNKEIPLEESELINELSKIEGIVINTDTNYSIPGIVNFSPIGYNENRLIMYGGHFYENNSSTGDKTTADHHTPQSGRLLSGQHPTGNSTS